MKENNIILEKTKAFAIRTVNLYKFLCEQKSEYVMAKQMLKCGTSIGANVREAIRGQSPADFRAKMNIALKEASESEYWLEILFETNFITKLQFENMHCDVVEIIKILTSIVKNSNKN